MKYKSIKGFEMLLYHFQGKFKLNDSKNVM